jgi:type I restriction enzyme M protein
MLDTETKRRIDTARDILVGKVPDPKSQVEQITIALIYKFMDDMDAESEEFGGKRKFFAGEFARYGWAKLMHSGLGGYEILNLYAESITKMPENPGIPPLFRDIFKNAYLPYRDPETLRAFLKIIDEFTYEHSERLGDAFEYLLSVLGSQGDAGQFRTPRHIIDFMVEVVDPKKNETILDPACGTAGFLISSYKHILRANTDADGNSTLTPDDKGLLAKNFKGYDISPDMVRLSLVNLYLHGFTDPHIYEYDTLTSEEKWNEFADVILANPPFMSPKGGIKPHKRFSVRSKRSEVLFVDYMAEHLTPSGRAGIIVPEGIIFQSQNAYKQLRKMLVEEYLVAVVSLPAGVFNPYSGVKTSVLILDKPLAKQSDTIGFFKVENDGFNLGAQRRPIERNDLPQVQAELGKYLRRLRSRESPEDFQPALGLIVPRAKVSESGEYNLSGERYREGTVTISSWPFVPVKNSCRKLGQTVLPESLDGPVIYIGLQNITQDTGKIKGDIVTPQPADIKSLKNVFKPDNILYGKLRPNLNKVWLADCGGICSTDIFVIEAIKGAANPALCAYLFRSPRFNNAVMGQLKGAQLPRIGWSSFAELEIPFPPIEVQKEIVAEIEGYQKVIDGARVVLDNYRSHIHINSDWPMVELGDRSLFRIESGGTPKSQVPEYWGEPIAWATLVDLPATDIVTEIWKTERSITDRGLKESSAKLLPVNSVIVSTRATIGRIGINRIPLATNQGFKNVVIEDNSRAVSEYVAFALTRLVPQMKAWATGGTFKELSKSKFCELRLSLPPLATQQSIVAEIEAEQKLVNANRELIARMEKKIQATIASVWGEES